MIPRILTLLPIAAAILGLSNCNNTGSGQRLEGYLGKDSFPISDPSVRVLANANSKPKDRHAMPIYPFRERNRIVRTTAYTCSEWDHLKYGNKNAAGTNLLYGNRVRSAAADWSFYPVGTTFRIKGLPQLFIIDDYGSALTGTGTIDLYKPNKTLMNQWGRRYVELEIVQWGSFERSAQLLCKRTHHHHCKAMLSNIIRQQPKLHDAAKF